MIIFKSTFHFEEEIQADALAYLKGDYVKKAMASGDLYSPQLSRIVVRYEEVGASYNLTFRVKDKEPLDKWVAEEGGALQEELTQKFGDKVACFVTLKERIPLSV